MMNFDSARKRLKKLADGRYFSLQYTVTGNRGIPEEPVVQECKMYINGFDWYEASTWKGVLHKVRNAVNPPKIMKPLKADLTGELHE